MRRTKLVWFLAGVTAATATTLASSAILQSSVEPDQMRYLVVSDRVGYPDNVPYPDRQIIDQNPRILKECKIARFFVWAGETTSEGVKNPSGFDLPKQSDQAINCVLAAVEEGKLYAQVSTAQHPNELAPSVVQMRDQLEKEKDAQTH